MDNPVARPASGFNPTYEIRRSWCPVCGGVNLRTKHNEFGKVNKPPCAGVPQPVAYRIVTDDNGCIPEVNENGQPTGRRIRVAPPPETGRERQRS